MDCPHCGRRGACPPGTCLVRDDYDLHGASSPKASKTRKAPAALGTKAAPVKVKAPNRAAKTYAKREIMDMWEEAGKADRTLTPKAIPYGHRGSKVAFFGIRIYGSLPEIKDTLGKLKTLLRFESGKTRLGVTLGELTEKGSNKVIPGCWVCYIQIFQRG